ncbi:hypothetical protein [Bacteroides sp. 51]|uniref:hypothetical protein n=1 Tax=Bacteroides sp. 51 TaxID=2302938 RepID=UPI0013D37605|nr:hypothetical protein [Bacteroides sp. 51]NDV82957.1 hypothetical protein [Bacteroides sp. 51]
MKNISEYDGLSRGKRLEKASTVIPLQVLEDDFPVLLARILHRSDEFASYYCYQPLVILSEIENFSLSTSEDTFHHLKNKQQKVGYVCKLIVRIEDWRKRLEYACINTSSLVILKDLNGQIRNNIAPFFPLFQSQYNPELPEGVGKIWYTGKKKTLSDTTSHGLMRRFFSLLLASIKMMQRNSQLYREEICSSGMMDPSLAVITAFLRNYKMIAGKFNEHWRQLPYLYLQEILKAVPRPMVLGTAWLFLDKNPAVANTLIPAGTYFPSVDQHVTTGYKLFSDTFLSDMKVEMLDMIVLERNRERHPENVLNYVTALSRIDIKSNLCTPVAVGFQIQSNVLLLREGVRRVSITCKLTSNAYDEFKLLINRVSSAVDNSGDTISAAESLSKILHDSFSLEATVSSCWGEIESFRIRFLDEERSFLFQFHLDEDFPALEPLHGEEKVTIRLLVNNTAWLFPYSWASKISFESVHIKAEVQGVQDIRLYNELGEVDAKQSFTPFGVEGKKGSWLVFGSYEMACKSITRINFSFNWLQLPADQGGLHAYYRTYNKKGADEISNQSFCVRTEFLQNDRWKPTSPDNTYYMFRTQNMQNGKPEFDGPLINQASIAFDAPGVLPLRLSDPDNFRFKMVHSGFYRLVFDSPEMGFGSSLYRQLFADVMMLNSRSRKERPLPNPPIAPLMDVPSLSYVAEEECFFTIGQSCPITFSYINPLSTEADTTPNTTRPLPLLQGPVDEGNFIIAFSGAEGQNIIRMYVEMELLQREIDHDHLPVTDWYFKTESKWVQFPPGGVLRDDTGHLMHSGGVELQLPHPVGEEMLDDDGLFRICVSIHQNLENCSSVRNIYVNVAEAEVTPLPGEETIIPAIAAVRQITPVQNAVATESRVDMKARISERMSHRNRALLPEDYEQMVLQAFPEIIKVKCVPGIDAKEQGRSGVVTLALVCDTPNERLPLCEDRLLCKVEDFLQCYTSPFVIVDAINPVYEEVTAFCGITIQPGYSAGVVIADIHQSIDDCIAPWFDKHQAPVFGYSFSMRDLYSQIRKSKYVEKLHGIKLAHLTKDIYGANYLNREMPEKVEEITISPSAPWAILVPAVRQYIIICTESEWRENTEYGDLEVGNTFVIG